MHEQEEKSMDSNNDAADVMAAAGFGGRSALHSARAREKQ